MRKIATALYLLRSLMYKQPLTFDMPRSRRSKNERKCGEMRKELFPSSWKCRYALGAIHMPMFSSTHSQFNRRYIGNSVSPSLNLRLFQTFLDFYLKAFHLDGRYKMFLNERGEYRQFFNLLRSHIARGLFKKCHFYYFGHIFK